MIGYRHVYAKVLSATVVFMFVFSSVLGLIAAIPSAAAVGPGDLTISGPFTISNTNYILDGNLTITSTGTLTITNADLNITSDKYNQHSITVEGKLIMNGATITTQASLDSVKPWPLLNMTIQNGGSVIIGNESALIFPGILTMTGSNSRFIMRDSVIDKLPSLTGLDTTVLTTDYVDDGPAINIDDSTFNMYDSSILSLPEGVNHANLSLMGTANLTAVNSYISVDFQPSTSVTAHNQITMVEHANAYLYGCTFSGTVPATADSAISGSSASTKTWPTAKLKDNTAQSISSARSVDLNYYIAAPTTYLGLKNFTAASITTYDILAVSLTVVYAVDPGYNGNRAVNFKLGTTGTNISTGIIPVASANKNVTVDLLSYGVDNRTEFNSSLIISFYNSGSVGSVQFDAIYLTVVVGPQAYVYRWGNINVTDAYGIPLSGATISAKFNGSTWQNNQNVFYYVPGTTQTTSVNPPTNVLSYMGKTAGNYKMTDALGAATIPYLTDIIYGSPAAPWNLNGWPNSFSVGSINVTATSGSSTSWVPSYSPYPQMTDADAIFSASSVSIAGASATTWDSSKYLVVPLNQTLIGAYTHFGDVIVKNTGVLTIQDAFNVIYQNPGNTAKVTVYSGGTLKLSGASLTSDTPLDLQVKSGGTLIIANSTMDSNVAITAHGTAVIQITGSTIEGSLTLDSDASMTMEIKDTTFTNAPTFGGSSVVSIVNVTATAINQEDNSRLNLYRYAMVAVEDLTTLPLSGAVVNARFQLDPIATVRATGISDPDGMVPLKLLVNRMNCSGGTVTTSYFGNYQFNATYNLPPNKYAHEDTLTFKTYPSLDSTNNILPLTLTIPVTFADLTFGPNGIYTIPSPPRSGSPTWVNAQVLNVGSAVVLPFNVSFYYNSVDLAHFIGNDTIAAVASGGTSTAGVYWVSPPAGITSICAIINPANPTHAIVERDYSNNGGNISVGADITIDDFYVMYDGTQYVSGIDAIPSNREIVFHADIRNAGSIDIATPITVILYNGTATPLNISQQKIVTTLAFGQSVAVTFTATLPIINVSYKDLVFTAVVNPTLGQGASTAPISEINMFNNLATFELNVTDSRPDPKISASNISIYMNSNIELNTVGNNISYATNLHIVATIVNGGFDAIEQVSVSLDINGTLLERTLGENAIGGNLKYVDLNGTGETGSSVIVAWDYIVTVRYAGPYKINVTINKENSSIIDKNTSNNNAWRLINVTYITPVISVFVGAPPNNVTAGTLITITGDVKYPVTLQAMANIPVTVQIQNGTGVLVGLEGTATTSTGGVFSVQITIPTDTPAGQYKIVVTVGQTSAEVKQIKVLAQGGFDMMLIIIIIAVVAAALVFTYYIYRQGVGKLVECGECGSLIPESSKKCPKCGVEFEEDMVKCSECGAWIASASQECPNCHVKFGTPLEGEKTYEQKMMDQYELTVVAKYRDVAKGELGKNYSEEAFQSWWAANPAYIAFEDWLVREEERRKQSNLITCSVCGTPNPPNETNCNSCGSPLEGGKGGSGGASTVVIEKRVIRQPVDRKVVPKKVIKKPLDEQKGGQ